MKIGEKKEMLCMEECNKQTMHILVKKHESYPLGNETIEGDVLVWRCCECGEDDLIEDDRDLECKYNRAVKKQKGLLLGEEIKAIREKMHMSIEEFTKFLASYGMAQLDEESYEEIETDYDIQEVEVDEIFRKIAIQDD